MPGTPRPKHKVPPVGLGAGYTVYTADGGELHTVENVANHRDDGSLSLQKRATGITYAWAPGQWLRLVWRGS